MKPLASVHERELKAERGVRQKRKFGELGFGLLFASPVLHGYVIFVIVPIAATFYLGFTSYSVGIVPKWLGDTTSVVPTLLLFSLWTLGNTIVIFLAGLQGIPGHLYEAIELDGGNRLHKLIYITIPMSSSIIFSIQSLLSLMGFRHLCSQQL